MIKKFTQWLTQCRHKWEHHTTLFMEKGIIIRGRGCIKCFETEVLEIINLKDEAPHRKDGNVIFVDFSQK